MARPHESTPSEPRLAMEYLDGTGAVLVGYNLCSRDLSCTWRGHGHGLDARRRGVRDGDGDGDEMDGDGVGCTPFSCRCWQLRLSTPLEVCKMPLGSETVGGSLPDSVIRLPTTNW